MNTCEAHAEIKEQIRDHEKRLVSLEKTDAEFVVRFENLCAKMDQLMGWIKAFVISIVGTGVGFIIWYIQSLPR